jgi:hypothetical protein
MKQCFKCKAVLPKRFFYRHKMMGDGRLGKCKECTKTDVKLNRLQHIDHYIEFERKRWLDPVRKSKDDVRKSSKAYRLQRKRSRAEKRNPMEQLKDTARRKAAEAIARGELVRQPCRKCGAFPTHGHHPDYSRPLDVIWLCPTCHLRTHNQIRRAEMAETF